MAAHLRQNATLRADGQHMAAALAQDGLDAAAEFLELLIRTKA